MTIIWTVRQFIMLYSLYTIYLTNILKKTKKKGSKEIYTVLQSRKKGYFLMLFHLPFDDMTYKMIGQSG